MRLFSEKYIKVLDRLDTELALRGNTKYLSRDEYLALKALWKDAYMKQSELIRAEKQAIRQMSKGGWSDRVRSEANVRRAREALQPAISKLQSTLSYDRKEANYMMQDLTEIKDIARASKLRDELNIGRNYFIV